MNELLKALQAEPSRAQIGLPPMDILLNGTTWKEASLVAYVPTEEGKTVQVYIEIYVCAASNDTLLLAGFISRKDDAATYLEDANRIMQGIVFRTSL